MDALPDWIRSGLCHTHIHTPRLEYIQPQSKAGTEIRFETGIVISAVQMVSWGTDPGSKQTDPNCKVCTEFKGWARTKAKQWNQEKPVEKTNDLTSSEAHLPDQTSVPRSENLTDECPLDITELGRATWGFLHTMASYYPDSPNQQDQQDMRTFLRTFSKFYPCSFCGEHLQRYLSSHPVQVGSRTDLERWFCDTHNEVNERLGKPRFDCSKVRERWRDGPTDGRCG